jgi:hypothetical protein
LLRQPPWHGELLRKSPFRRGNKFILEFLRQRAGEHLDVSGGRCASVLAGQLILEAIIAVLATIPSVTDYGYGGEAMDLG